MRSNLDTKNNAIDRASKEVATHSQTSNRSGFKNENISVSSPLPFLYKILIPGQKIHI